MKQLSRFYEAQSSTYNYALKEVRCGRKLSHWMWFIFPQLEGLGRSPMSEYYGIQGITEAKEYLHDEILGKRLNEISQSLLDLNSNNAVEVFGFADAMKLKSCMTLFSFVDRPNSIYTAVLNRFFNGTIDHATMVLLHGEQETG